MVTATSEPLASPPVDDRLFRRLVELAPDAMVAHRAGRIIFANDAAATQMGAASAQALVGMRVMGFVAPESQATVVARMQRMLTGGQPEPLIEETFLRLDGQRLPVEVAASPIGDGVVLVVLRDISARVAAERERQSAEARARAFFASTSEAMGISRLGVHLEVNAAYARMFGFEQPAELVGRSILDLLHPSEHPRITEQMQRRARGEPVPAHFETLGVRRDGTVFTLEVQASAYPEAQGFTTVVVMRDVTARRAAEERLEQSERRYRELMQRVPVGVWEYDLSGPRRCIEAARASGVTDVAAWFRATPEAVLQCVREAKVLSVNATACAMVGARDTAEVLANVDKVFLPETLPEFASALAQLSAGASTSVTEGWNGTLSGDRIWVAVRSALVAGHEHDWSRVLVTTTDLTERWKARQETEALQDRLRHAEKLEAVGRLAGGVAHDFNNLLAAILGNAELALIDVPPGSEARECLQTIQQASHRARDLVKQILTFGRKDRPHAEPLDFPAVVGDALGLARAAIPATVALEVSLDLAAGTVLADRTQLHQIVLNLCTNARDAMGQDGHLRVEVARVTPGPGFPELRPGPHVRLRVSDDGCGMDEPTRARIFEPYMTTKGPTGGHGLGLAVVHGIVASLGGAIRVDSSPGHGATFDLYFPLAAAVVAPVAVAPTPRGGQEHILLVDDEPLVRSAHRRLLQSLGYQVTEAVDGEAALACFRASPTAFRLVISDQSMPKLSGLDLARTLHHEAPGTPVVLCTGYSDVLDEAVAREVGLKGLLEKPIDRDRLAAMVRKVLG